LSDYLFVLARYLNIAANHEEILWEKKKKWKKLSFAMKKW
jgi:cob(I)alamin adenosyltransferase